MPNFLRAFHAALALSMMVPGCLMAAPVVRGADTAYILHLRIERVAPSDTGEALYRMSLLSPVNRALTARLMNTRGYASGVSTNRDGNTMVPGATASFGFDMDYAVRPRGDGHVEVPVSLLVSEPLVLPEVSEARLDRTLDMVLGQDLAVDARDSKGGLRFVFHLEPKPSSYPDTLFSLNADREPQ